jgi:PKD repeat protein
MLYYPSGAYLEGFFYFYTMKKIAISFFSILLLTNMLVSQNVQKCGLSELIKRKAETDKFFFQKVEETKNRNAQLATQRNTTGTLYTIPVVFHILHQGGAENISNAQVFDAMKHMNNDFRKNNADTIDIVPEFIPIAADCEIEFKLATIDPDGNCTNGIIRHNTPSTNFDASYQYSGVGPGLWDPQKYMNIYVCKALDFPGAAAYTYIPGWLGAGSPEDAIVTLNSYVGGIGTGSQIGIHVLSHEVGHWLGLSHVWGDTNEPGVACGDDGVSDTPITKGWQTCNLFANKICDPNIVENVQNFMEYSYCDNMFTEGQKQLMKNVIVTGANAGRDILVSNPNLIATGVNPSQICSPIADFKTANNYQNFCTNQNIQFADNTSNAVVTNWSWSFPGGNPSTSIDSMPLINYASPGVYAVSYTATNTAGSSSITKTNYIEVLSNLADQQTISSESFESIVVPNATWRIANSNDANTWVQNTSIGSTGVNSMMINNYTNTNADVETLYTPSFNLAAINASASPLAFTFKLSYQQKNSSANERLQVFSSTNCGQTWSVRYSKTAATIATVSGYNANPFTPTLPTDWRQETVNISSLVSQQNVLFKFVFTSDVSGNKNNIYIDDINIAQNTVGVAELNNQILNSINIIPNPSNGQNTLLSIISAEASQLKISIVDVLGKQINTSLQTLQVGENSIRLFENSIPSSGIYFVKMNIGNQQITRKIIIE